MKTKIDVTKPYVSYFKENYKDFEKNIEKNIFDFLEEQGATGDYSVDQRDCLILLSNSLSNGIMNGISKYLDLIHSSQYGEEPEEIRDTSLQQIHDYEFKAWRDISHRISNKLK
jgi:hypothetical protein